MATRIMAQGGLPVALRCLMGAAVAEARCLAKLSGRRFGARQSPHAELTTSHARDMVHD